jgi:phage terminase large subunit
MEIDLKLEMPEAFQFLTEEKKYIVAYGGRGSGKSVNVARTIIMKSIKKTAIELPWKVLCTRSLQKSIRESVYSLIVAEIEAMGVRHLFEILEKEIRCVNGVTFIFWGLKHNIQDIKSLFGVKICWVEEAQNVSENSWRILIPTIRVEGAQFFITFNVDMETDATYRRFVLNPPKNAVVRKVNWQQNAFFPDTLREEMEDLREKNFDDYLHVWEGHPVLVLEGAIYSKEIRKAVKEERITKVPYDPQFPVHTFWDIGWGDYTSIWFAQKVGYEYRIIDFYENRLEPIQHYLSHLDKLRSSHGYVYGTHCLPHDARAKQLAAGGITVEAQVRKFGKTIVGAPRQRSDSLNAARAILDKCVFDQERTRAGVFHLTRYCFKVDPDTGQYSREPIHDDHSHAADAFEELAFMIRRVSNDLSIPDTTHIAMPDLEKSRRLEVIQFGEGRMNSQLWMTH